MAGGRKKNRAVHTIPDWVAAVPAVECFFGFVEERPDDDHLLDLTHFSFSSNLDSQCATELRRARSATSQTHLLSN